MQSLLDSGDVNAVEAFIQTLKEQQTLLPNSTYVKLVHGYARNGEIDKMCEVFDEMTQKGFPPTSDLFISMLNASFKVCMFHFRQVMITRTNEPNKWNIYWSNFKNLKLFPL